MDILWACGNLKAAESLRPGFNSQLGHTGNLCYVNPVYLLILEFNEKIGKWIVSLDEIG